VFLKITTRKDLGFKLTDKKKLGFKLTDNKKLVLVNGQKKKLTDRKKWGPFGYILMDFLLFIEFGHILIGFS
jgi:hypothetical protein